MTSYKNITKTTILNKLQLTLLLNFIRKTGPFENHWGKEELDKYSRKLAENDK